MRLAALPAALCLLAALFATAGPVRAQDADDEQGVELGREAFDRAGNFPWYNKESDSLERIEVEAAPAPPSPTQLNSGRSQDRAAPARRAWPGMGILAEILMYAILAALVLGLIALIIFAIRYITSSAIDVHSTGGDDDDPRGQIERIENLPFRMKRTFADLLAEARRCYDEGNFNEAIIYLYSYQLVHLDKRHLIRLTKGKTNRQYVREVRPKGGIAGLLAQTMLSFEEVFFGHHDLPRRQFENCWERLDEFHQMVDQYTAA